MNSLESKATEVAMRMFFCGSDKYSHQELYEILEKFVNNEKDVEEDNELFDHLVIWEPFEYYSLEDIYTYVNDAKDSIIDIFSEE